MIMPPDDRLARMTCLVQVLVRRKPIAASFTLSGPAPATLSDAPHSAAISNPSTHKALPWQRIGIRRTVQFSLDSVGFSLRRAPGS